MRETDNENPVTAREPGWSEVLSGGNLSKLLLLCFGVWLHAASSMLAATTLPSAITEIGGAHLIGWAFMLYQLGSIVAGTATGLLMARLGLRFALNSAAGLYGIGSLVCAMSPSIEVLLAGRLLQGIGGGWLVALVFVSLNRIFPPSFTPRIMAVVSAVWSVSAFCGPLVGGTFATFGMWRFAYASFLIQSVIFIFFCFRVLKADDSRGESAVRIPLRRLGLLVVAILLMSVAGAYVDSVRTPILFLVSLLVFALFLYRDERSPENRMLPSRPFSLRHPLGAGMVMVLCASTASMSFLVYGPLLLENLYGVTPLVSGYIVALESIGWGMAAIGFSHASERWEPWLIRAGIITITLGIIGFALTFPEGPVWAIIPCALVQGAGFGMMWGFVVRRIISSAPDLEKDRASSAIAATQQTGFALGAATTGIVANTIGFSGGNMVESGQLLGFWIFMAYVPLGLFACLAAWLLTASGVIYHRKTHGHA